MPKIYLSTGVTLEYQEYGQGQKILLCTQNFFLSGNHMELLARHPYDFHTYLVTMRGYGGSDHVLGEPPGDWIKTWAQDLLAFADAIGATKFYYTGISHGTLAGWYIALHCQERLHAFAAVSGLPLFSPPGAPLPIQLPQWYEDGIIGNREALKKMAWNLQLPTQDPVRLQRREQCREEHLNLLVSRSREEFEVTVTNMSACEATTITEYEARIAQIQIPLLIFWGMQDTSSPIETALRLASLVPGAKFVSYQHFEHGTPDECPALLAEECNLFFRQTSNRIL